MISQPIRFEDDKLFRWRAEPEIEDLTYGLNGHLQAEQHKDLPRNAQVRITQTTDGELSVADFRGWQYCQVVDNNANLVKLSLMVTS